MYRLWKYITDPEVVDLCEEDDHVGHDGTTASTVGTSSPFQARASSPLAPQPPAPQQAPLPTRGVTVATTASSPTSPSPPPVPLSRGHRGARGTVSRLLAPSSVETLALALDAKANVSPKSNVRPRKEVSPCQVSPTQRSPPFKRGRVDVTVTTPVTATHAAYEDDDGDGVKGSVLVVGEHMREDMGRQWISVQMLRERSKEYQRRPEQRMSFLQTSEKMAMLAKAMEQPEPKPSHHSHDLICELTPEEWTLVPHLSSGKGDNTVVKEGYGRIEVRRMDLASLAPGTWLNDEIINFWYMFLQKQNMDHREERQWPRCFLFHSFFYTKYLEAGYNSVRRWTRRRKANIFEYDKVIFPVHLGTHWCCAVINLRDKRLEYYDSLYGKNTQCRDVMIEYLNKESQDKRGEPFDASGWKWHAPKSGIPRQENGYDCGVFCILFAVAACQDAPFFFRQADMPTARKRLAYGICTYDAQE